jgi:hypothetical protein
MSSLCSVTVFVPNTRVRPRPQRGGSAGRESEEEEAAPNGDKGEGGGGGRDRGGNEYRIGGASA